MVNNLNKSPHSKHLHHHQDAGGKRHVSKLSQDLSGVGKDELELDEFGELKWGFRNFYCVRVNFKYFKTLENCYF